MITKLYDEDPRLDRDIAIAIKNRVLKEAMSEWASQTKLDKDVEIAVKNRALKEMMLSWSGKSTIHLQGEDSIGGIEPTGDIEGEIVERKSIPNLKENKIKETLETFLGKQMQKPPIYSSIKIKGIKNN